MPNVLDILKERGLFDNVTSENVQQALNSPVTVYAGFDPTSDSLQVGNFVTIMALCHFQRCGHKVIAVVGGATGMIGDPSGKTSERSLLSIEQIGVNQEGIKENLSRFLDFKHPKAPARIVNNHDWLGQFSFIGFLRDVGKHFRMGAMLGKESVRTRLDSESGMSFTEFSYQMLQAYDFLKLYDDLGCTFQIGGSDQWGNITAGTDLIRKLRAVEAYGVTLPLVCDSTGQKFGKSAGNAIYLDHKKTSYYDFYQFFVRTADADVVRFLKIFTFLPLDEIRQLEEMVVKEPEKREAQKRLAQEITKTVHGENGLKVALGASAVLFGEEMDELHAEDLISIFANVPSVELPISRIVNLPAIDVAVAAGLCKSKGEARRLVESGGLYINNKRIDGIQVVIKPSDIVDNRVVVLRSGKKTYLLLKIT
ncbi:MAG: tyrosine--tRNA ligase [Lentisphaerae bacterium RIFOXYA12_FULL_48_11]|nr:MAG: tyrosine--tRNA ligase [Lentisphaerae bacterium RIFOXYA12_FULL_48_11]